MNFAIVLGNFDGCHLGHIALFNALKKEAAARGLSPLAISFEPHTRHIIQEPGCPELLTPKNEKRDLIEQLGIPLEIQEFNKDLFAMTFRSFVEEYAIKKFGAKLWVLGLDQRFGRGGKGSVETLRAFFPNLEVSEISPVLYPSNVSGGVPPALLPKGTPLKNPEQPISASRIRAELKDGNIEIANAMLGRNYSVSGVVVHGLGQGRLLGFPTANLEIPQYKLLPKNGVYKGFLKSEKYDCVVNIGTRPSFKNRSVGFEAHLLNFNGDLYGKTLCVELTHRIRDEIKFDNIEGLKRQIKRDVEGSKE
ncbi:riboflavin biosynthesis protein [Fibrobacterales bacterium]|nr:riboflavin biosynthesis protein [Fibrobacterales bacterium]